MRSTNVVILVGNVGQDPRTGVTKNGHKWANASIATQKFKKDQTQITTWHRIVGWGKVADEMALWFKGDTVFVEGELENNEYEKNGQKIQTIQINARSVMKATKQDDINQEFSQEYPEQGGF